MAARVRHGGHFTVRDTSDPPAADTTPGTVTLIADGTGRYPYLDGDLHYNAATEQLYLVVESEPFEYVEVGLGPHKATAGPTSSAGLAVGRIWVNTTTDQAWICTDAAVWQPIPARKVKTTTQTTTSATLQSDTALHFPVTNGRRYAFRFGLLVQSADVNTGIALALSVPSFHEFGATSRIPESGNLAIGFHTASDDERVGGSVAVADATYHAVVEGIIRPSANGTVTLRFRSSDSGVTVRVLQSSFVEWSEHYA